MNYKHYSGLMLCGVKVSPSNPPLHDKASSIHSRLVLDLSEAC